MVNENENETIYVDEDLLFSVIQTKVNNYVRKLVEGQGGNITRETIIIMIPDIMMFVATLRISEGSTKKRLVLSAIDTVITSSKNLSDEEKNSLILINQMVIPHVIDKLVWASGQANNVFNGETESNGGNKGNKCCNII